MEVMEPLGGGASHALTSESGYVAPQLIGALDAPDTPTPNHGRPEDHIGLQTNHHNLYLTELDQNGGQGAQKLGRPSKTVTRPSEARSGIRQRKASREVLNGKPKHQAHLVDAKKQAQALAGVLELAQTQQQDAYQDGLEQLRLGSSSGRNRTGYGVPIKTGSYMAPELSRASE